MSLSAAVVSSTTRVAARYPDVREPRGLRFDISYIRSASLGLHHLADTSSPSASKITLTLARKLAGSRTNSRYSSSCPAALTLLWASTILRGGIFP